MVSDTLIILHASLIIVLIKLFATLQETSCLLLVFCFSWTNVQDVTYRYPSILSVMKKSPEHIGKISLKFLCSVSTQWTITVRCPCSLLGHLTIVRTQEVMRYLCPFYSTSALLALQTAVLARPSLSACLSFRHVLV